MRYLLVLLTTLFAFFTSTAAGENVEGQWQKANKLYEQKQYDSAAYYYEQVAAKQPNEYVYFNLGNAYYRLNLVGAAVLNYEKALHINPANKEAADNLTLTQSRINNRIQAIPEIFFVQWWNSLASGSKAGTWALASLSLFLCFIGLLFAKRFNKIQGLPPQVLISLVCINILCLVLAFASAANKADSGKGVVMQNDAPIYANPAGKGKATNLVPEGTTVEITDKAAGSVEIKLPDGRVGWIDSALVRKI